MGQANSTITSSPNPNQPVTSQDFVKNYQFVRKIKDLRYGEIYLLQDKSSKEIVALREIVSKSAEDFEREMESLRSRAKISHPNIVKIRDFTSKTEDVFGASINKILVILEFLDNDLEREITLKKARNDFFTELQLWTMIDNVIKAFSTLQRNNITHQDLKPNSMLISSTGSFKISQPNLADNLVSAYNQLLNNGSSDGKTYLSPALLANLRESEPRPDHDPWKSDAFAFGMILLHAATLTSCDKLYNWNNYTLNYDELERKLSSLRVLYSPNFIKFTRMLLNPQEDKRPDFLALEKLLPIAPNSVINLSENQIDSSVGPRISQKIDYGIDSGRYSSHRQDKRSKIGIPAQILQESHPNIPKSSVSPIARNSAIKYTPFKVQPTKLQQEQSMGKAQSKTSITDTRNSFQQDKGKSRLPYDARGSNTLTRGSTSSYPQEYLSRTSGKEKTSLGRELSPNPSQNMGMNTEYSDRQITISDQPHSINTLISLHKTENITTIGSLNEIKPKDSLSSHRKGKSGSGAQYQTLISAEVAQLIIDFKDKMEKQRSPVNANTRTSTRQNISTSQKDILMRSGDMANMHQGGDDKRVSTRQPLSQIITQANINDQVLQNQNFTPFRGAGSPVNNYEAPQDYRGSSRKIETPVGSHRSPHASHRSPEPSSRKEFRSPLLESNSNVQRVRASQAPYYTQMQANYYQPLENSGSVRKENNALSQHWDGLLPKNVNVNDPGKVKQGSNQGYVSLGQENIKTSFEANKKNLSYQPFLGQQIRQQEQIYRSVNQNNSIGSATSLEQNLGHIQNTGKGFDPYLLFNRSGDQNIVEKSPVLYEGYDIIKPKESIKATSPKESLPIKPQSPTLIEGEIVNEKLADGSVYKGQKKNGLRHGKGTYFHADGGMYTGDWFEGAMEGDGTLYYASGPKAYRGQWKADKFHGKGTVYNEAPVKFTTEFDFTNFDNIGEYWVKYEGEFCDDNKQGQGVLSLANGEKFEGKFRDDMVEGIGAFYTKKGKIFKGEWWQNKLIRPL